ncbi:hypothetical protein [Wenyingzhuangia sp. IMCC45467]
MLKDNYNSILKIPSPSIKKGTIKAKLIEFLEDALYEFQKHFKGKVSDSEESLNEQLGKILSFYSKSQPFIFQPETKQKQIKGIDRRVDIGVFKHYLDPTPFFTIEAKRLTKAISKNREKEYVLGNDKKKLSGGIERFKHNIHGVDLKHSAIIGYVQDGNVKDWYSTINSWIQDLIDEKIDSSLNWFAKDLLVNKCGFKDIRLVKSISENLKIDKSTIVLNHYFVNLK